MRSTSIFVIIGLVILLGGFLYFKNSNKHVDSIQNEGTTADMESDKKMMEKEGTSSAMRKVLAGKSSPFLEFSKADYEKALADNKIIILDFYANWCPICRAEAPILNSGFDSLTGDKIVGFRVNFKDSDTDKDEEKLTKDFNIPYQHTKVILKNGKEFSRSLDSWTKELFDSEVTKALQ